MNAVSPGNPAFGIGGKVDRGRNARQAGGGIAQWEARGIVSGIVGGVVDAVYLRFAGLAELLDAADDGTDPGFGVGWRRRGAERGGGLFELGKRRRCCGRGCRGKGCCGGRGRRSGGRARCRGQGVKGGRRGRGHARDRPDHRRSRGGGDGRGFFSRTFEQRVQLKRFGRRQGAILHAQLFEQGIDPRPQVAAVPQDPARADGENGNEREPGLLRQLCAAHGGGGNGGFCFGEMGQQARVGQRLERLADQTGAVGGRNRPVELGELRKAGCHGPGARISRQPAEDVDQLPILDARQRRARIRQLQHRCKAIVEMHYRSKIVRPCRMRGCA